MIRLKKLNLLNHKGLQKINDFGNDKGGGAKTLNLESVNGATLDSDYIFTNNQGGSWVSYPKYFKTKIPIDLRSYDYDTEFKIKFKTTRSQSGIFCADKSQTNWNRFFSGYVSGSNALWISIGGNYSNPPTLNLNTWYWFKMTHPKRTSDYKCEYSIDGVNYTLIYNYFENTFAPKYMWLGAGASTGSEYTFSGSIDFKETDIIIDGKSVLWV